MGVGGVEGEGGLDLGSWGCFLGARGFFLGAESLGDGSIAATKDEDAEVAGRPRFRFPRLTCGLVSSFVVGMVLACAGIRDGY